VATAYETPTSQELSNRPSGEGGFNPDLEPETLRSVEGGVRGLVQRWRLSYDIAGYRSALRNGLVRFERDDEQEFYRNAGESSRDGIEAFLDWHPVAPLALRVAYTYQRFSFDRFASGPADFSGNLEPGAPPHQLFIGVTWTAAFGVTSTAQFRWVDAYPVDNQNTVFNWAARGVDLRFVLDRRWTALDLRPFFGIDNVFDERYNGSTVPNAVGNRFFEPSPGRLFYVGLRAQIMN
jgi:iron complex outermembrane receptor protein